MKKIMPSQLYGTVTVPGTRTGAVTNNFFKKERYGTVL